MLNKHKHPAPIWLGIGALPGHHQGLENRLMEGDAPRRRVGRIGRRWAFPAEPFGGTRLRAQVQGSGSIQLAGSTAIEYAPVAALPMSPTINS